MYQNLEAEKSVIGCILASDGKESIVTYAMQLSESDFTDFRIQQMFAAVKKLYEKREKIDIVSLGSQMNDMGCPCKGKELLQIAAYTPAVSNHRTHVNIVRECADRRRVLEIAKHLAAASEAEDISAISYEAIRNLNNGNVSAANWQTMGVITMKAFERMEAIKSGELEAIKTGIASLDRIFGGFFPGELTILAARPSVGKSAFALSVASYAARKGKKIAFVSREMSPESIANRMISQCNSRLRGEKLRDAELDTEDWVALGDAINELSHLPIYTIYTLRNMEDLHREVRTLASRMGGLDLIIVDYAQLMHMGGKTDNRTEELEEISGSLKELAMSMQIPVLALAQVKRSGLRTAVMPTMDELKGSGSFEQDADNILLLHRPENAEDDIVRMFQDKELYNNVIQNGKQYIAIKIAKQRQGEVGGTVAVYDPAHNLYSSVERRNP